MHQHAEAGPGPAKDRPKGASTWTRHKGKGKCEEKGKVNPPPDAFQSVDHDTVSKARAIPPLGTDMTISDHQVCVGPEEARVIRSEKDDPALFFEHQTHMFASPGAWCQRLLVQHSMKPAKYNTLQRELLAYGPVSVGNRERTPIPDQRQFLGLEPC